MHVFRSSLLAVALLVTPALALASSAGQKHPEQLEWSFDGVLGKLDKPSVQRGLQVYKEVCAACHGLKRVPFRKLTDIGFSEAEAKAFAAEYTVTDGPNDEGEMFDRPGRLSDKFPSPYANDNAARSMNNGAMPPDLSLIVKARPDGANYVHALLVGYEDAPHDVTVPEGAYYNPYFPGGIIKMPPPISDGQVTYQNADTPTTKDQIARDVVNFLQWAAEPEMEERKRMGIKVMIFLAIMTGVFYATKKRIWSNLEH